MSPSHPDPLEGLRAASQWLVDAPGPGVVGLLVGGPAALVQLVRTLTAGGIAPRVLRRAGALVDAPEGSVAIVRLRVDEVAALQGARPQVVARRLRVLLWAEPGDEAAIRGRVEATWDGAPRVVRVPPELSPTTRVALAAQIAVWEGDDLHAAWAAGGDGGELLQVSATAPYGALVQACRAGRPLWVRDVRAPERLAAVLWAVDETGHRAGVVLDHPLGAPAAAPLATDRWVALDDLDGDDVTEAVTAELRPARSAVAWPSTPRPSDAEALEAGGWLDVAVHVTADPTERARWLLRLGDADAALRAADEGLASDVRRVACLLVRSDALAALGRVEEGLADASLALAEATEVGDEAAAAERVGALSQLIGDWRGARLALQRALQLRRWLARQDSGRDDLHRDVANTSLRLGDLHQALGDAEAAMEAFVRAHDIAVTLARRTPDPTDRRRDVSVALDRLGGLYQVLGDAERALEAFEQGLDIARSLAGREPGRADLQRDLAASLERIGDVVQSLGETDRALGAVLEAYDLRRALAAQEPGRADLQRELAVALHQLGGLYQALGEGECALAAYEEDYDLTRALVAREPARVDLRRDLTVSLERLADLYQARGDLPRALQAIDEGYDLRRALAAAAPERADLQRDLAVTLERRGSLRRATGDGAGALGDFQRGYDIARALSAREPGRTDLQRDVSVFLERLGSLYLSFGDVERARHAFEQDLAVARALAQREPGRADLQRDLAVSFERLASVQAERAAEHLDAACVIWRRLHAAEPGVAAFAQGLAGNRVQRARQVPDDTAPVALAEARHRLRALRDRRALEARLVPLLEQLDGLLLPPWPG